MAEKPEELVSTDEKVSKASELFARGCRNFYVKSFGDAAEDLSQACTLYSEVYGPTSDEIAEAYLLYGKSLIALGKDENKLIDVPEEEEEDDEAEDGGEDGEEEGEGDEKDENEATENGDDKKESDEKSDEAVEEKSEAEATVDSTDNKEQNGHKEADSDQPGPSGLNGNAADTTEDDEAEDGNLQVAWEVLEIAAEIFQRNGEKSEKNLLETYSELAGISVENGNFDMAIKDYLRALEVYSKMAKPDKRFGAEINYKIGLCQTMVKLYDESVKSFQKAHDLLNEELETEQKKEDKNEDSQILISELEDLKKEIQMKILEVGDVKAEEMEQVKKELSKLLNHNPDQSDDGAGCSSSISSTSAPSKAETEKPKPTDISHLIKRKKPDTVSSTETGESPAKKVALDK